jgi:hypothetical protein
MTPCVSGVPSLPPNASQEGQGAARGQSAYASGQDAYCSSLSASYAGESHLQDCIQNVVGPLAGTSQLPPTVEQFLAGTITSGGETLKKHSALAQKKDKSAGKVPRVKVQVADRPKHPVNWQVFFFLILPLSLLAVLVQKYKY